MNRPLFHTDKEPFFIAGPCSVESWDQLHKIVSELHDIRQVGMIRCGIWKPRTRPGGFEGIGEIALNWIDTLKQQYPDLRFCCEVARPEHIELCLNHHIDAVWIGARTSGNPFSVEELAQALHGSDLGVMVKNPIAADVSLWQGAIERIQQAGVGDIAAIHRGFYIYHDGCPYRNKPMWEVAADLHRRMPDLPIFCDPSHMGGHRQYIKELTTTADDLGYNGYMIEVHPHPETALTDGDQQIDTEELAQLIDQLEQHRKERDVDTLLYALRQQIDAIDERVIHALCDRMDISRKIAQLKNANHIDAYQPLRWSELLRQRLDTAQTIGLDKEFIRTIYETIHAESIRIQERVFENGD